MVEILTRGRKVEIPQYVDELTPEQYEFYCFLASSIASGILSLENLRIAWMSRLLGMDDFTILLPEYVAEIERQLPAIDGFFIKDGDRVSLDFDTPVNILKEYAGFTGPGDWLDGLSYGDFTRCLEIMQSAGDSEIETSKAYRSVARILYHIPEERDVPSLLEFHAPMLFTGVWRRILAAPVEVNGQEIDFRIIFRPTGESRPDDKTGWTGITFEVASTGVFGNVAEVEKTDFWAVLLYLYKCKFEYIHDQNNQK